MRARPNMATILLGASLLGLLGLLALLALGTRIDLAVYRLGGDAFLHGLPLYDQIMPGTGLPFTYPPFAALLFGPLAVLPKPAAQLIWAVTLLACLAALTRQVLAVARTGLLTSRPLPLAVLAAGVLATEPIRSNLAYGQINIPLMLLIIIDLRRRSGPLPAGILIGIAGAVKLTPLIFIPYLLCTGRRRDAGWAALSFSACSALAALATPTDSARFWTRLALDPSHVGGVAYAGNQSLAGVATRLAGHAIHDETWFRLVTLSTAAAGIGLAVAATRRHEPLLGWTVCGITGLLVSPISWTHHWLWALPALAWLAGPARPRGGRFAALGGFALLVLAPMWWLPYEHNREYSWHGWQLLIGNSYTIAAVLFLLTVLGHLLLSRPAAASTAADGTIPDQPAGPLMRPAADQIVAGRAVGSAERTALAQPEPNPPSSTTTLS
ncbi:glycosyltransferase 87 family protein [Frankia sp. Cj3]|uniref:glycosyltransferase 87 family protein n=1 Tax=Frankia sp. Cj3 TaxID=2880976 RepID=UPI001EF5355C|nr:glycosyltransferase 87 family protein [Frankia sp. Cj3]